VWSQVASNHPSKGETVSQKCIEKTVDLSKYNAKFPSPREQKEKKLANFFCGETLQLIFKIDNSPACVKPDSVQKLIERGWAKP